MHRKNRPANWTGRLRQGLSHGKSAMDAMRCPGSIRGMLTGYGFRKSCCSKRRSLRSFLITSAFWGCFRMCLLWRTRRWMRSCSAGVAVGYYSRARNLHKCAKMVVDEYQGVFPSDPALLERLPGIGRSTAAAIAVFSSGVRAAILDGNVVRVFSRVFGVDDPVSEAQGKKRFWQMAVDLLPDSDIESYTQGLMDLGATVCTRGRPDCAHCPFSGTCIAFAEDRIDELPVKKAKKTMPIRHVVMLLVYADDRILLEKGRHPEFGAACIHCRKSPWIRMAALLGMKGPQVV